MSQDIFWSPTGATNPSVGATGSTAPTSATLIGSINLTGNLTGLKSDSSGNLLVSLSAATASVTANQGTPNTIANAWPVKPTDGTNSQSFTAAGEAKVDITTSITLSVVGTGTAGTPAGGVLSIQGVASGTAVPVSISGTVATSNLSVSATGSAVPADATYIGMSVSGTLAGLVGTANGLKVDGSAVTQPISATSLPLPTLASTSTNQTSVQSAPGTPQTTAVTIQGNASGVAVPVSLTSASQPINTNGSIVNTTLTGTTASAPTAPANAVGFIIEASSGNSDNIRWCIGGTSSSTVGMRLEPGRDSGFVPCKATISVCAEASTTSNAFQLQWILSS